MNTLESPIVYIVDDELESLRFYEAWCTRVGFKSQTFQDPEEFLKAYESVDMSKPHVVLSDVMMEPVSGLDLFKRAKAMSPWVICLFISGSRDVEIAVEAMKSGAFDFISKNTGYDEFRVRLEKAFGQFQLQREKNFLEAEVYEGRSYFGLWGKSDAIKIVYESLRRYQGLDGAVLVTGEPGAGLIEVARAFHSAGNRKDQVFVTVSGGLLSVNELKGYIQKANGGSLFITNVDELSQDCQFYLSDFLSDEESKNVQFIVGTHKDLRHEMQEHRFHETLYFQVSVYPVELPALRNRKEDIPVVAAFFLRKYAEMWGRPAVRFSKNAVKVLINHPWPGNCLEIDRTIERAVILSEDVEISEDCIQLDSSADETPFDWLQKIASLPTLKEFELEFIKEALKRSHGRKERAAKILGIGRKTLYRKELELRAKNEESVGEIK